MGIVIKTFEELYRDDYWQDDSEHNAIRRRYKATKNGAAITLRYGHGWNATTETLSFQEETLIAVAEMSVTYRTEDLLIFGDNTLPTWGP